MKKIKQQSDVIQFLSVSNLIPLLSVVIAVSIFIFKLQASTELITYKLDIIASQLNEHLKYVAARQEVVAKMQQDIVMLRTIINSMKP